MNKLVLLLVSCTVALILMQCAQTTQPDSARLINNPEYGPWQDSENPPLRFEKVSELVFSDDEEPLIAGISWLNTDQEGNLYFYDWDQKKLTSLTPEGELRWRTGQQGKGPGDFENPQIILHIKRLYVWNIQGSRLDVYDLNGHLLKNTPINKDYVNGSLKGITSNDQFIISTPEFGTVGGRIKVLSLNDGEFRQDSEFMVAQSERDDIPENVSLAMPVNFYEDMVITAVADGEYLFRFFDTNGDTLRTLLRDFDKLVGIGTYGGRTMFMGAYSVPVFLSAGYFITHVQWPVGVSGADQEVARSFNDDYESPGYRHSFDLYSPEGKLLYSMEGEGRYHQLGFALHVDKDDHVYFLNTYPELRLGRYKVVIEPPQ